MTISDLSTPETETLLSEKNASTVNGCVEYKGQPTSRFSPGGLRSASILIALQITTGCAYNSIYFNLITYLTGPLGMPTATAAANVNAWSGVASLLPLLGGFVADSLLGRYRTILFISAITVSGLGMLTLSALLTSLSNSNCLNNDGIISSETPSCSPPQIQLILFFFSLYLVASAQGGQPCVQAFGADQFDENNPEKNKFKSSFFNWWFLSTSVGSSLPFLAVNYIQDNLNWTVAFAILFAMVVFGLLSFLLGTKTYRYSTVQKNEQNPFVRIGRVFVLAFKHRNTTTPKLVTPCDEEEGSPQTLPPKSSQQFKFLNKALVANNEYGSLEERERYSSSSSRSVTMIDIEEAKALLRLIPIWTACLAYAIVYPQSTTFFTKQAATMDRTLSSNFQIPAATLQLIFSGVTVLIFIPIYDRIFVPVTRALTRIPSGITMLQRIGIGWLFSVTCMIVAGLAEMKRLETAEKYGLIDNPNVIIPISAWWLAPQYLFLGLSEVLTVIGLQEFFYDQVPKELKSVGLSICLGILGVGSLLSGILVSTVDGVTSGIGGESWFASDLNRSHLHYFYWLLALITSLGFVVYLYFAKSFYYRINV